MLSSPISGSQAEDIYKYNSLFVYVTHIIFAKEIEVHHILVCYNEVRPTFKTFKQEGNPHAAKIEVSG